MGVMTASVWPDIIPTLPPNVRSEVPAIEVNPPEQIAPGDTVIAGAVPQGGQSEPMQSLLAFVPGVISRIARMPSRLPNLLHKQEGSSAPLDGNHGMVVLTTATPEGSQSPYAAQALTWRAEPDSSYLSNWYVGMGAVPTPGGD